MNTHLPRNKIMISKIMINNNVKRHLGAPMVTTINKTLQSLLDKILRSSRLVLMYICCLLGYNAYSGHVDIPAFSPTPPIFQSNYGTVIYDWYYAGKGDIGSGGTSGLRELLYASVYEHVQIFDKNNICISDTTRGNYHYYDNYVIQYPGGNEPTIDVNYSYSSPYYQAPFEATFPWKYTDPFFKTYTDGQSYDVNQTIDGAQFVYSYKRTNMALDHIISEPPPLDIHRHDTGTGNNIYSQYSLTYYAPLSANMLSLIASVPNSWSGGVAPETRPLVITLDSPVYNDSYNNFAFNIHLSINGTFPIIVQKSADCYSWTTITATPINVSNNYLFTDSNAGTGNAYYRACTPGQGVKSVNAVGFISVGVPVGWSMRANQLGNSGSLSSLFYSMPAGTLMYKWDSSSQSYYTASSLYPGEGVLIYNPGPSVIRRIVGELRQGSFSTYMPSLKSMVSSQVPKSGYVESDLLCPFVSGEVSLTINTDGTYSMKTRRTSPPWPSGEPYLNVADSFIIQKSSGQYWNQTYSVW